MPGPGRRSRLRDVLAGASLVTRIHLLGLWRSRGHRAALISWVVTIYLLLGLGWAATGGAAGVLLGLLSFASLSVGLCVAPTVAASRLARDRDAGILPFLQVSDVRPGGLALGAWCSGVAAPVVVLLSTLPALAAATYLDDAGWAPLAQSLAVQVVVVGALASLGVLAATRSRTRLVALAASYVGVGLLAVGTLIAYALASSATIETVRLPVRVAAATLLAPTPAPTGSPGPSATPGATPTTPTGAPTASESPDAASAPDEDGCVVVTQDVERYRPDRVWGFLALNPYVVLADALPGSPGTDPGSGLARTTPVEALSASIRRTRMPPGDAVVENCIRRSAAARAQDATTQTSAATGGPVWPIGVAALYGLGAGSLWLASRGLRTPADRVGRAPGHRLRTPRRPGLPRIVRLPRIVGMPRRARNRRR